MTNERNTKCKYDLEAQVGHQLRRASQRHIALFTSSIQDVTPTQFAALAKTYEVGPLSQNALGRATAMDAATIKGVIDRLQARGLMKTEHSKTDRRRLMVRLTQDGRQLIEELIPLALEITEQTLEPLSRSERKSFLELLRKMNA